MKRIQTICNNIWSLRDVFKSRTHTIFIKKNQMSKGTYLQYYVLILMMMVGMCMSTTYVVVVVLLLRWTYNYWVKTISWGQSANFFTIPFRLVNGSPAPVISRSVIFVLGQHHDVEKLLNASDMGLSGHYISKSNENP